MRETRRRSMTHSRVVAMAIARENCSKLSQNCFSLECFQLQSCARKADKNLAKSSMLWNRIGVYFWPRGFQSKSPWRWNGSGEESIGSPVAWSNPISLNSNYFCAVGIASNQRPDDSEIQLSFEIPSNCFLSSPILGSNFRFFLHILLSEAFTLQLIPSNFNLFARRHFSFIQQKEGDWMEVAVRRIIS